MNPGEQSFQLAPNTAEAGADKSCKRLFLRSCLRLLCCIYHSSDRAHQSERNGRVVAA